MAENTCGVSILEMLFELIKVSLGHRKQLSKSLSPEEWRELHEHAIKQAVVGIAFKGVEKLPKRQWPPLALLYEWIGLTEQIRRQNTLIDKQTHEIWKHLKEDGLDVVVLKGQGIATYYDVRWKGDTEKLGIFRQSGDIDIWIKGGYQRVCDYVQQTHPTDDVAYHRFHCNYYKYTEVELHHRPTLMRNLFDNKKIERWYNSFGADSFVYLDEKGFAVPSVDFNRIYILTHIYRHFLFEGIGLRQVIDYYFVLRSDVGYRKDNVAKILQNLRLMRFAEAIMWILHTQLGLEEQYLICGMNEKEGQFVLSEILQTGNFGQGDKRYNYKRYYKLRHHIAHGSHLLLHYPSEVIWTPIWLIYHKLWKWNKKRKIRKSWK